MVWERGRNKISFRGSRNGSEGGDHGVCRGPANSIFCPSGTVLGWFWDGFRSPEGSSTLYGSGGGTGPLLSWAAEERK